MKMKKLITLLIACFLILISYSQKQEYIDFLQNQINYVENLSKNQYKKYIDSINIIRYFDTTSVYNIYLTKNMYEYYFYRKHKIKKEDFYTILTDNVLILKQKSNSYFITNKIYNENDINTTYDILAQDTLEQDTITKMDLKKLYYEMSILKENTNEIQSINYRLKMTTNTWMVGTAISIMGSAIVFSGLKDKSIGVSTFGSVIFLSGTIIKWTAIIHLKKKKYEKF